MKSGPLFWGSFFIGLGILFFLDKFCIYSVDGSFFTTYWPVIFIFFGALIIITDKIAKAIVGVLFGFFNALLIFSFFNFVFWGCDDTHFEYSMNDNSLKYYSESYESNLKSATLEVNSGAGIFSIDGTTDELVSAKSRSKFNEHKYWTRKRDSSAYIEFEFDKNFKFWNNNNKNELSIKLNENPVWKFDLNIGAAKSMFDLSPFKVHKVFLNTGATDTNIKFGDKYKETYCEINMGAANVNINIPMNSGIKLNGDNFLIKTNLPDNMYKINNGAYISENYEEAENKIKIQINGAAAGIKINRY